MINRPGRATEDCIKAIFSLSEDGGAVSTSRLARYLEVSAPAATKAIRLLAEKKFATYRPYRGVALTTRGRREALKVLRRHRLLELFLQEVLGYRWDEVDVEAERLEHHVSDKFIASIDGLLGYPEVDPHGDPIPGLDGTIAARAEKSLAECDASESILIVRVRDRDPAVLQYLDQIGLRPETTAEVVERQPFNGPLTLRIVHGEGVTPCVVGNELAGSVFVRVITPDV